MSEITPFDPKLTEQERAAAFWGQILATVIARRNLLVA